jgi:hypothetical protein
VLLTIEFHLSPATMSRASDSDPRLAQPWPGPGGSGEPGVDVDPVGRHAEPGEGVIVVFLSETIVSEMIVSRSLAEG